MIGDAQRMQSDYFEKRFDHLRLMSSEAEKAAWNYLLAINGGGAAGMLAFIGAVPGYRQIWMSYLILAVFVLGLVFVGGSHVNQNIRINRALIGWRSDWLSVAEGKILWLDMLKRDGLRTENSFLSWFIGFSALACFLVGVILAAILFYFRSPTMPI
ncbi:hypothetical protein AVMA1855_16825 [Acidovorax sp. SUPP1855]|uniref:hypothetical protein n=1 Tax=Acidovorax sp. SUPP1855 TaxID=431774 RepID=UPI0023DE247C|nr:hypothetical protein [Acidovorax sp. SUPP1855]GKS85839.1 hypothetical protein AVMA1855_16825 [Acidovorax sp. SUPP1855]